MEKIRQFFEQKISLPEQEWNLFLAQLTRKEYLKKDFLLRQGQTEKYISFIEKGSIRFFVQKPESEVTFAFIFENDLVCAYDSFLTQMPCLYAAQALEDTIVWQFSYETLQYLYQNVPVSNVLGRWASEEIYLKKAKRELSFLLETPEERYLKLFTERPNVIKQIPLQHIASYIGITPQALSRIRKRIF